MNYRKVMHVAAAAITFSVAGVAHAEDTSSAHSGMLLRARMGGGGAATVLSDSEPDVTLGGEAGTFALTIGATVAPNLIIGGTLSSAVVVGPELKIGDETFDSDDDVDLGIFFAGVSVIYYIMPINMHVTGSVGALMMSLGTPDDHDETDTGFGLSIEVGKEWFVSDKVGLGLGLDVTIGSVPDGDDDSAWGAAIIGGHLSATYN